jgi:catechol 2,3-dioxygenase-like lactoylglutathione lyase family enzyme
MIRGVKYSHTNLIARDWRALARFYAEVLGCVPVPPERDYAGPDLDRGTAVRARGEPHLRLPGRGPTVRRSRSITLHPRSAEPSPREPAGFGHIAFEVESVAGARGSAPGRRLPVGDIVIRRDRAK